MKKKAGVIVLGVSAFVGCAKGYHAYPCGDVHYAYCVGEPLPYTLFEDCDCPTPISTQYQIPVNPAEPELDSEAKRGDT